MSAHCFHYHHAEKTRGVLWRNGARKKQFSFWVKKIEISLEKNTGRGNWYQCGCGFPLGDYFQSK
jgi:hypothetical protein